MRHFSLSQRLFVVVAVALLPTIIILALNLITLRREAEERLSNEAFNSAKIATLEMNRIVGGIESLLNVIASAPVVLSGNMEACDEFLARVNETTPELSDLAVADADGNVVCRSSTIRAKISVADRDYFQAVRSGADTVTGTFAIGRVSGLPTLPIAMAVNSDSVWKGGVIAAGLDLAWLGSRLKERDFLQGNALTIADRNGVILAREPSSVNRYQMPTSISSQARSREHSL